MKTSFAKEKTEDAYLIKDPAKSMMRNTIRLFPELPSFNNIFFLINSITYSVTLTYIKIIRKDAKLNNTAKATGQEGQTRDSKVDKSRTKITKPPANQNMIPGQAHRIKMIKNLEEFINLKHESTAKLKPY